MTLDPRTRMILLRKRRINAHVSVSVGQEINGYGERSQYMGITIEDSKHEQSVTVRLSTFREIVKALDAMGWTEARHLTDPEKKQLDKRIPVKKCDPDEGKSTVPWNYN